MPADATDPIFNGSLCWAITNEQSGTSYLFGSIHQMDSSKIALPLDYLEKLLTDTGALCVEVDLREVAGTDEMGPTINNPGRGDGDLATLLGPEYHSRLLDILATSSNGSAILPSVDSVPLPLLTLIVTVDRQLSSPLFKEANLEIETHMASIAAAQGLPIHELETVEEQMALLADDGTPEEQARELRAAIDLHGDRSAPDMFRRYADQDLRLLSVEEIRAPEMASRNRVMASRLEKLLRERTVLAIVGAAHLPYDTGILAELRNRGFTVTAHPINVLTT